MATPKLDKFQERLSKFKGNNIIDIETDYDSRHNYCTMVIVGKVANRRAKTGGLHKFEVRGFLRMGEVLSISAVNWTLTAGPCSIDLTEENVVDWDILEDNKILRILYDHKG